MGQAFRRASGRIKASSPNIEPMASSKPKTVVDRQPPVVGPTDVSKISRAVDIDAGQWASKTKAFILVFHEFGFFFLSFEFVRFVAEFQEKEEVLFVHFFSFW